MASTFLTYDGLIFYDTKLKAWVLANLPSLSIPIATDTVLGGIKVGTGLSIAADGTLSANIVSLSWDVITGKPTFAAVATSGSYNDLTDKPTIPTLVSQLTNDAGYQTATDVAAAISEAEFLKFEKVDVLPDISVADARTIYLVPKSDGVFGNYFEEWLLVNGAWELIGTTAIDLSNYWNKTELVAITNAQIDALFA